MRRSRLAVAGLAALALPATMVACSGSAGGSTTSSSSVPPEGIPPCTEVYVEGQDVTRELFGEACLDGEGQLVTPLPVRIECTDSSRLYWNDLAWGYLDGPMTLTPPEEESRVPHEELDACLSAEAADS
jgi:hypothetical protein